MVQATTTAGESIRVWREAAGLRQDEVATAARAHGLDWTRDTVAAIENGRRELAIGELVLLRGAPVSREEVAPLFARVKGARGLPADSAAKQDAELKAARKLNVAPDAVVDTAHKLWGRTLTEERDHRVKALIGTGGLVEHVDKMRARGLRFRQPAAGVISMDRMVQARRGHVTRALVAELEQAIKKGKRR